MKNKISMSEKSGQCCTAIGKEHFWKSDCAAEGCARKKALEDIIFDMPIFSENGQCLERLAKKYSIALQPEMEQERIAALILDRIATHA